MFQHLNFHASDELSDQVSMHVILHDSLDAYDLDNGVISDAGPEYRPLAPDVWTSHYIADFRRVAVAP